MEQVFMQMLAHICWLTLFCDGHFSCSLYSPVMKTDWIPIGPNVEIENSHFLILPHVSAPKSCQDLCGDVKICEVWRWHYLLLHIFLVRFGEGQIRTIRTCASNRVRSRRPDYKWAAWLPRICTCKAARQHGGTVNTLSSMSSPKILRTSGINFESHSNGLMAFEQQRYRSGQAFVGSISTASCAKSIRACCSLFQPRLDCKSWTLASQKP